MTDSATQSVLKQYLAFGVAYCIATGILLLGPVYILESRLTSLIYYQMTGYDVLSIYLLVLPFLVAFALNFYSFGVTLGIMTDRVSRALLGIVISVVVASVELYSSIWIANYLQTVFSMSMVYVVTGAFLILILMMVHTLVTVIAFTDSPLETAERIISDPTFWFAFPIVLGLILISLYPVFQAQTLEGFFPITFQEKLRRSMVEFLLVIPTCFLIPALPWVVQHAASRET